VHLRDTNLHLYCRGRHLDEGRGSSNLLLSFHVFDLITYLCSKWAFMSFCQKEASISCRLKNGCARNILHDSNSMQSSQCGSVVRIKSKLASWFSNKSRKPSSTCNWQTRTVLTASEPDCWSSKSAGSSGGPKFFHWVLQIVWQRYSVARCR